MNLISKSLSVAVLAFAGVSLSAEDFNPLMKTTQATWPEKKHIGVICNYQVSKAQVWDLAKAAGTGALITVIDARVTEHSQLAASLLTRQNADYVVLLPKDPLFGDGSFGAIVAMNRLARKGIPTIGTRPVALKQGAVFSMGEGTDGQLLVTDKLIGTVDVILPNAMKTYEKASLVLPREGMATVLVSRAR